jgi:hypothetical protein
MAIKVNISFKESEREMFEFLDNQISASYYIKQLIKEKMDHNKPAPKQNNNTGFQLDI